jgi:hypothetical protein
MQDPKRDANAPTNRKPDPAPSKVPLPIPWISPEALPDVPLVHSWPSRDR